MVLRHRNFQPRLTFFLIPPLTSSTACIYLTYFDPHYLRACLWMSIILPFVCPISWGVTVEFTFCVYCYFYGLIMTEICITSILIIILDSWEKIVADSINYSSLKYWPSIVSYGITICRSTSEYLPSRNGLTFMQLCHIVTWYMEWCASIKFNVLAFGP